MGLFCRGYESCDENYCYYAIFGKFGTGKSDAS